MKKKQNSAPATSNAELRSIPSVDELVTHPRLAELSARAGRSVIVESARAVLAAHRKRIVSHKENPTSKLNATKLNATIKLDGIDLASQLIAEVVSDVEGTLRPSLRPVINA